MYPGGPAAGTAAWERPDDRAPAFPYRSLVGGLVAYNEERNLEPAARSLLDQQLPPSTEWSEIWIVISGCTDGTERIAKRLAAEDSRIRLVREPERRGKAVALDRIVGAARGRPVVLLNADARAEPLAVSALIDAARRRTPPLAVMARPCTPPSDRRHFTARLTERLWRLHHAFHLELLAEGEGNHLSDELLLLVAPDFPGFPAGTINDGAYLGAWLERSGGARIYAPDARVAIQVPGNFADYLRQRRRILVGHAQIGSAVGRPPSTLPRLALHDPRRAWAVLRRATAADPIGLLSLPSLVAPELLAQLLANWDRLPPRRDHVRWERIASSTRDVPAHSPREGPLRSPDPGSAR